MHDMNLNVLGLQEARSPASLSKVGDVIRLAVAMQMAIMA